MATDGSGEVLQGPWQSPIEDDLYARHEVNHTVPEVQIVPKLNPAQMFLARLQELSDANVQIAFRKNSDYANPDQPFANFDAAPMVGVSVPRGLLVRMQDKMQRISNLLDRPAAVKDESILETCSDLANYALILRIWLEWNHGRGS